MAAKIDISPSKISGLRDFFDLLIITATPTEKNEVHKYLEPVDGWQAVLRIQKDQYTYFLGKFGHYNAIHVATGKMGAMSRTASIHTAMTAIDLWAPKAVLMVGIAFGIDPKKVRIGDVLLSDPVVNYETHRANPDGTKSQRGAEGPASTLLLDRYKSMENWEYIVKYDGEEYAARQLPGLLLSGEILVDSAELKAELVGKYPEAIGGEMEGIGIFTACDGKVSHWIIAKAVCDFGDGTKGTDPNKDLYQQLAIESAVSLSHAVFRGQYSFEDINLYSGTIPDLKTPTTTEKKKFDVYLTEQLDRQLARQKASLKYIPSTFVEVGDAKEMMRYFCSPITFLAKIFGELSTMEFNSVSEKLLKAGHPEFDLSISPWSDNVATLDLPRLGGFTEGLHAQLSNKAKELAEPPFGSESMHSHSHKVSYISDQMKWFRSRVCLIKEDAGQGKTNFICDFVDNFIINRHIPSIFLLGNELVPDDIRGSILRKVFPDSTDITFSTFLSELRQICLRNNQPFILIIDGINENAYPNQFAKHLENFITEITEHEFVRIVITCRSEYYRKHFNGFGGSAFSSRMTEIGQLRIEQDPVAAEKIFSGYLDFFHIQIDSYNTDVFKQLTGNFLLLRIFCDSHQGEHIRQLGTIYKQTLFQRYYRTKVEEITKRINEDDELKVMGKIDIRRFLEGLIEYMINKRTYESIPLDDILIADGNRKMYVRFLDENILVRRDPKPEGSVFDDQEVVNFTFDEFRDFLLADYLVTKIYPGDVRAFEKFLQEEVNPSSRILEGCGTFLFYIARKANNEHLNHIIKQQSWYPQIFRNCIFNIEDSLVADEDRAQIFDGLRSKGRPSLGIFYQFLSMIDIEQRPNLNLEHYLAFLRQLNSNDFDRIFSDMFYDYGYGASGQAELDRFLKDYKPFLDEGDGKENVKGFEVLLYMFKCQGSWKVTPIYEQFFHRYPELGRAQITKALTATDGQLTNKIQQFCKRYDILL